jgi:hypothetical protein
MVAVLHAGGVCQWPAALEKNQRQGTGEEYPKVDLFRSCVSRVVKIKE